MNKEQELLERRFKRFKKKYFKNKTSFTGLELQQCKEAFLKTYVAKR